jgi:hypothetical protein
MENNTTVPFYSRAYIYFGLAFLITIAGFFPSYFGRLSETGGAHHFHGITATLWMLLLVVQPLLYRLDKIEWHRMLGRTSFLLVPLIVIGGLIMVHMMLNDERYPGNMAYQLGFIDFFVIIMFVMFYVLAIKNVRDTQYHARYMVCTIFGPIIPALTRLLFFIPYVDSFGKSLNISYILVEIVLILLIMDDKRRGKIRLPYILALGLMAVQHLMMNFAGNWAWWQWLMDLYGAI